MTELQQTPDNDEKFEKICVHMCKYAVVPDENPSLLSYIMSKPSYHAVYLTLKRTIESGKYSVINDEIIDFPEYPSTVATLLLGYGRRCGFSSRHDPFDQFLETERMSKS